MDITTCQNDESKKNVNLAIKELTLHCQFDNNMRMATQAQHIIEKCGGYEAVAEMCNTHVTRVYRWTYPKSRTGGTGGLIPGKHHRTLLTEARKRGIPLTETDFFLGEVE